MTDLAELRRLAEQAIRSKDRGGPTVEQERFEKAANPAAILSLLDELDTYWKANQSSLEALLAAEQRVRELEEGLRTIAAYQIDDSLEGDPAVFDWFRAAVREARQLLQASAQDASEGSGTDE